jgi:hypothetical protein
MKREIIEFGLTLLSIIAFAFLLNYVWESYHAVFLYEAHDLNAEKYVRMLSYVSAVDGALILTIYLFMSLLWKDVLWLRKMSRRQAGVVFAVGLMIAAFIEYRKVFVLKAWSYTPLMLTVFGIGLSPLLQLSSTALLAFWITRKIVYQGDGGAKTGTVEKTRVNHESQ